MKQKLGSKKRPRIDKGDAALLAVRVGASAIPFGGPIATILSGIKPNFYKRLNKDVEEMDRRLLLLEREVTGFNSKTLKDDESFQAVVNHWVQVAIRTHDEEKRKNLRNAVVNSAIRNPSEEDLRPMFFKWVDDLEPWHLRILKFLDDPKMWARRNAVTFPLWYAMSVSSMLREMFPEMKDRVSFYIKGLVDKGLLIDGSYEALQTAETALGSWTTPLGKQFLSFITSGDGDSQSDTKTDSAMKEEASKS